MRVKTFLSREMTEDRAPGFCNHREGLTRTGMRVGGSCPSAETAQC